MRTILLTGFEPFGGHPVNPTQALVKALDGQSVGGATVRGVVLPVERASAAGAITALYREVGPAAVVHTGLAASRPRLSLERVAVNVDDYEIADNLGVRPRGEPCIPGGPPAYFATLPLSEILDALRAEGIPAAVSNTAGTYLCNHILYAGLHEVAGWAAPPPVGFLHVPLLPSMVAASGLDQPSMSFETTLRGLEVLLDVVARALAPGRVAGAPRRAGRTRGRPLGRPALARRRPATGLRGRPTGR